MNPKNLKICYKSEREKMAKPEKKEADLRRVKINNARLSFPHLFEPQEQENDDGSTRKSFNCVLMIPKEENPHLDTVLKRMKVGAKHAKIKAWGEDEKNWPKIPASMTCFKDGDNEDHFTTPRDEYADHYIISTSSPVTRPPRVVTNRKGADNKWVEAEEGRKGAPYAGCYVNAVIDLYGQKKDPKRKMPNRINASIAIVQFLKDGEPFSAAQADPDDILDDDDVGYEGDFENDIDNDDEQEDDDLL